MCEWTWKLMRVPRARASASHLFPPRTPSRSKRPSQECKGSSIAHWTIRRGANLGRSTARHIMRKAATHLAVPAHPGSARGKVSMAAQLAAAVWTALRCAARELAHGTHLLIGRVVRTGRAVLRDSIDIRHGSSVMVRRGAASRACAICMGGRVINRSGAAGIVQATTKRTATTMSLGASRWMCTNGRCARSGRTAEGRQSAISPWSAMSARGWASAVERVTRVGRHLATAGHAMHADRGMWAGLPRETTVGHLGTTAGLPTVGHCGTAVGCQTAG
mmetsp:Transcript_1583/g.5088  ORF Transcript_1583/g.5088 Transcript_1583/m.5088 type:complete len:276 (+) Transcript_1583:805-1632(+)